MTSKFRVFVTRNVPQRAIDLLKEKVTVSQWKVNGAIPREMLKDEIRDVHGLLCLLTEKIDEDLLKCANDLKVIGTMSVGYDHIDLEACRRRNILLGYTPDVLTEATAELTMALLLCTTRRIIEANKTVHNGGWGTWGPMWMCGRGIANSTIGIVGMGRIGHSVVEKLKPFHPGRIVYYDPFPNQKAESELGVERVSFEELLSVSDFVSVHSALTDHTKHLFNTHTFKLMKQTAVLVNTSRGALIDECALYEALSNGGIQAAGLDVSDPEPMDTNNKLLSLDNFVMLPHIGSATTDTREAMACLAAENILAGLQGQPLKNAIP